MSHSSKEAAVLATVSVAEAALEKRLLRLRDDGAPSAVEAAASEAAAMGDCCNRWQWPLSPMRQKQSERLKKTDWPKKQLRQRGEKPKKNVLREKQLSLLAHCRGAPGERRSSSRRNNYTCNMVETGIVEPGTIH